MALDVSDAIALAKDLLKTSGDFRPHDPNLAEEFSNRAYEICDDLGIDHALIGEPKAEDTDDAGEDDAGSALIEVAPDDVDDDDVGQTSDQLRNLLQQQALVLQHAREVERSPEPKAKKRSFRLFGRFLDQDVGELQSA